MYRATAIVAAFLLLGAALPSDLLNTTQAWESCDVEGVYEAVNPAVGTLAVTDIGQVVKVRKVLSPLQLESGSYEVTVSEEQSELYKVDGQNIYLKTSYCLEMAVASDAILRVSSGQGYTIGELIFEDF